MSILRDLYLRIQYKKRCEVCGCVLHNDSEFDVCEECLEEIFNNDFIEKEINK